MPSTFQKLNLKDQAEIVVVNAPESFEPELARLGEVRVVRSTEEAKRISFFLAFVLTREQIDELARSLPPKAPGDSILWFAYPKGSSKRYRCDFNRDTGWDGLNEAGFSPVRQVAIDEDWSALRFRRKE